MLTIACVEWSFETSSLGARSVSTQLRVAGVPTSQTVDTVVLYSVLRTRTIGEIRIRTFFMSR